MVIIKTSSSVLKVCFSKIMNCYGSCKRSNFLSFCETAGKSANSAFLQDLMAVAYKRRNNAHGGQQQSWFLVIHVLRQCETNTCWICMCMYIFTNFFNINAKKLQIYKTQGLANVCLTHITESLFKDTSNLIMPNLA